MSDSSNWDSIQAIASMVRSGEITAVANVEKSLKLIDAAADHNAVLWKTKTRALERAKQIDDLVKSGKDAGRLAGVPFIAKDNYLTFDTETTAASNILSGFEAPYQATVIEKLEAEGAIMVAKANMDSFAHGASNENSDFGPVKNAHDKTRVSGGSSGGSATAVALGLAPFALGSDTGGSIRQPASFNGVVGFKPTYGTVSRYGVVAMISSTDCMGPITTTTADSALIYDIIAGQDSMDSTTIDRSEKDYTKLADSKKLKIGLIKEHMADGVDDEVKSAVNDMADKLKAVGHEVGEVSMPELDLGLACYYIIMPAEVTSNLARYDGIRFGLSERGGDLQEVYTKSRSKGFSSEVKRRVMIGNYVLSSGYYDAYYKKAQKVRTLIIDSFKKSFQDYDILIGPVSPDVAFKIGDKVDDPVAMYMEDLMTGGVSLAGLPAISVPIAKKGDLPIGLQVIGAMSDDKKVLETTKLIEGLV